MAELRSPADRRAFVDAAVGRALAAVHAADVHPRVLRLLLRCYAATGRTDIEAALGAALAAAIDTVTPDMQSTPRAAEQLLLYADALRLSDDERLRTSAECLIGAERQRWRTPAAPADFADRMTSVDACLRAADAAPALLPALLQDAVDVIERQIAVAYAPGRGIVGIDIDALRAHVSAADALLTAYGCTGRLPYSMLAEELLQHAMATCWPAAHAQAGSSDREAGQPGFTTACAAAAVLGRLHALHGDREYLEAAVVAPDADYAAETERLIVWLGGDADRRDLDQVAALALAILAVESR